MLVCVGRTKCAALVCCAHMQLIRESLLPDSTPTSSNATASTAHPAGAAAGPAQQQQQQQLPDALSTYAGGPVFLVTDMKSTGDAASNIATMPSAPFLYGVSIGICMSSATSQPGGAGLGTVGWHEVRDGVLLVRSRVYMVGPGFVQGLTAHSKVHTQVCSCVGLNIAKLAAPQPQGLMAAAAKLTQLRSAAQG
jgi:hypothetical protein